MAKFLNALTIVLLITVILICAIQIFKSLTFGIIQEEGNYEIVPSIVLWTPHPLKIEVTKDAKEKETKPAKSIEGFKDGSSRPLYIITPTYRRPEQIAEMTRMSQALTNVPNVVWIVSEEAASPTKSLIDFLNECPIEKVYLRVQMPEKYNKLKKKPRGVANRRAGLQWIRDHAKHGVIYFADDDNTYDTRLFEDIRSTKKVSMFPVGLIGDYGVSSPVVKNGKVDGYYDGWEAGRKFPVDMAGFAFSVEYFLENSDADMPYKPGYEEDGFLLSLNLKASDVEPKAHNCTKIWVWHTKTEKSVIKPDQIPLSEKFAETNIPQLQTQIDKMLLKNHKT